MSKWENGSEPRLSDSRRDPESLEQFLNLCFKTTNYFYNYPQLFLKYENNFSDDLFEKSGLNIRNLKTDFSQVVKKYPDYFIKIVLPDESIIGFCALHPLYFNGTNKSYCGLGIGSVAVHPDYRGKRFAQWLLSEAEKVAKSLSAEFMFLFSSKRRLYEDAGFRLMGQSKIVDLYLKENKSKVIHSKLPRKWNSNKIKYPDKVSFIQKSHWWNFICTHSKKGDSLLSFLEFCHFLKTQNLTVYELKTKEQLHGISFANKGNDFQNVLYGNYVKNKSDLIIFISQILKFDDKNIRYIFLETEIRENGFASNEVDSFYVKILDENCNNLEKEISHLDIYVRSLQGI